MFSFHLLKSEDNTRMFFSISLSLKTQHGWFLLSIYLSLIRVLSSYLSKWKEEKNIHVLSPSLSKWKENIPELCSDLIKWEKKHEDNS
jgi:hypothetical protein